MEKDKDDKLINLDGKPKKHNYVVYSINQKWITDSIQVVDYMSNPSISKKNFQVLDVFIRQNIQKLLEDDQLFKELKKNMKDLKLNCYGLSNNQVDAKAVIADQLM